MQDGMQIEQENKTMKRYTVNTGKRNRHFDTLESASEFCSADADGYDAEWHAREAMITENRRREQDRMMLDGGRPID